MKDEILDDELFPNWDRHEEKDFVEIRTYPFDHEAQIAKAFLEAEGIPSFLKNANMLSVYSGLSAGFGGVGLIVLGKDAEHAIDVLDKQEEEIEVNDEMLTEAYLQDMELEAAEEEFQNDDTTALDAIKNIIFITAVALFVVYLIYSLIV